MKTKLIEVQYKNIDIGIMEEAGAVIRNGGLVAFPTETVYGLGGDALNPRSSSKIYEAKGRPSDNPLIVHIAEFDSLAPIVLNIPQIAVNLADAFWPGPLTIIFEKSELVPLETTGGLNTVAVRMPNDVIALAFIKEAGGYVAAPSANVSGKPSPTMAKYVAEDMDGRIDMILDAGQVSIGLESTIVDITTEVPCILRPGYITKEMLEEVVGKVETDKTILDGTTKTPPKAPGMRYRHYAPKGDLTIIDGPAEDVISYINQVTIEMQDKNENVGIICTDETLSFYKEGNIKSLGKRADEISIAKELYRILREFDDEKATIIYSESFDNTGMGQAIMNRLLKAAGHKVHKV